MQSLDPVRVSSTEQMWEQYIEEDILVLHPEAKVLYVNPVAKVCTLCWYVDTDPRVIIDHYLKEHVKSGEAVMVDQRNVQTNLMGGEITEDDRRLVTLASVPKERMQCPFCFTVYENSQVVRFFTKRGVLSTRARCPKEAGGCGLTMMLDSMRQVRQGPQAHGRFLGTFGSKLWFEKVQHDTFMPALKKLYPKISSIDWDSPEQPMSKFWLGYGETNTTWAEKHRQNRVLEQALRDAKASGQVSDDDNIDETGR